ncbi:MAG: hypothetical protein ACO21G_07625, partial [Algoriphagus sp.]
ETEGALFVQDGNHGNNRPRQDEFVEAGVPFVRPPDLANGEVDFRISCSKGTYIRSLARDLGVSLGVGAYLKSLCRTRIGTYSLNNAKEVSDLVEEIKSRPNENLSTAH